MTHSLQDQSSAAPATSAPAAQAAAATFTAADGGETYSGSALLVEAYAAIWLVLMAWLLLLWRKQAKLTERLDALERTIDRAAATLGSGGGKAARKEND